MDLSDQNIEELFRNTERSFEPIKMPLKKPLDNRWFSSQIFKVLCVAASLSLIIMLWSKASVIEDVYQYTSTNIASYETFLEDWYAQIAQYKS